MNDSCIIQNGILSLENITIVRSQIKVELTMALDSLYKLMRVGLYLPVFTCIQQNFLLTAFDVNFTFVLMGSMRLFSQHSI